jgi:hypothetical protein
MVEDTVTDGTRIAQLLASELTGLEVRPLDRVEVVDADSDAMPADSGTLAYRLAVDDAAFAAVRLYPEYIHVEFESAPETAEIPEALRTDDSQVLTVTSGAEVKSAVDVLRAVIREDW